MVIGRILARVCRLPRVLGVMIYPRDSIERALLKVWVSHYEYCCKKLLVNPWVEVIDLARVNVRRQYTAKVIAKLILEDKIRPEIHGSLLYNIYNMYIEWKRKVEQCIKWANKTTGYEVTYEIRTCKESIRSQCIGIYMIIKGMKIVNQKRYPVVGLFEFELGGELG